MTELRALLLPSQLVYRAATKLLHHCLSLASLWMVPKLWFMFFISASTVLLVLGRPHFHLPSGVQWIATLVIEFASLYSTYSIQRHCFLVMKASISSCWHHAKRSRLKMVGSWPKDVLNFPEACCVKGQQLGQDMFSHPPAITRQRSENPPLPCHFQGGPSSGLPLFYFQHLELSA